MYFLQCLFILLYSFSCLAKQITISNTRPRTDLNGELMDIHDGNLVQWSEGGLYFWYGMGYGNCTETMGTIPPRGCPGIYQVDDEYFYELYFPSINFFFLAFW
jgi:hypothetical protein